MSISFHCRDISTETLNNQCYAVVSAQCKTHGKCLCDALILRCEHWSNHSINQWFETLSALNSSKGVHLTARHLWNSCRCPPCSLDQKPLEKVLIFPLTALYLFIMSVWCVYSGVALFYLSHLRSDHQTNLNVRQRQPTWTQNAVLYLKLANVTFWVSAICGSSGPRSQSIEGHTADPRWHRHAQLEPSSRHTETTFSLHSATWTRQRVRGPAAPTPHPASMVPG